jgi:hypothetical protein
VNTALSTPVDTYTHQPQRVVERTKRVRLSHRLALHLGLALITWSRRPSSAVAPYEQRVQREAREWGAERQQILLVPRR